MVAEFRSRQSSFAPGPTSVFVASSHAVADSTASSRMIREYVPILNPLLQRLPDRSNETTDNRDEAARIVGSKG
jgi:hypothetical protein